MRTCPSCGEENPEKFRRCGYCGAVLDAAAPADEVRKTVTIVFSDIQGSTAMGEKLDSEAVREVMSRYFDEMRGALEGHGGTVEKYVGDAIMAVFGLPRAHEDDAQRAVRAAAEMRERLADLNGELERRWGVTIGNRTGVNTGEVVAGDPSTGQRLVTGDTVNTAARLEQAALVNDILLGEATYRLVRHAIEAERAEQPLELKGKAQPVQAYRLVSTYDGKSVERRHETQLVGRRLELSALRDEFVATVREHSCRLVTVVAQAGVGKSRLIEELARLTGPQACLVRGRCLPYGRGITFWPLAEIARGAAGIRDDDPPAQARAKLAALAGSDGADAVARVSSAIGLGDTEFPLDEVIWGTRKLFERLAAVRPLIVVVEDIHWAEDAFLDLIEHVAVSLSGAPVLLVCTARPDLFEHRSEWQRKNARMVDLQPLSDDESALVVGQLLGDAALPGEARRRIIAAAEGNPLFVEQLLSMLIDDGLLRLEGGCWTPVADLSELAIPATIHALLAARLDLLSPQERAILAPAAVIGVVFDEAAVRALVPEHVLPEIAEHLASLTEKQLVRRLPAPGSTSYRFQHILIRDAAYQGILKRSRATLHERFADWAEQINRERQRETEFEEILGYHLEQAYGYLSELGPLDEHGLALSRRAADHLASAGGRAFARGDMAAAANLLRRAAALLPVGSPERIEVLPDLGEALQELGAFEQAQLVVDEAVADAAALGNETLAADAVLTRLLVSRHVAADLDAWRAEVDRETMRIIPQLDEEAFPDVLAKAWRMVAFVHGTVCRWEETVLAAQRTIHHARAAGDRRREARAAAALSMALCAGPTPARDAISELDEILASGLIDGQAEAVVLLSLGVLNGMIARFDEARDLCARACRVLDDRGGGVIASATSIAGPARVELLAGRPDRAEGLLYRDNERLAELNERYYRPLVAAVWSQSLFALGRLDEATSATALADELASPDDVEAQALWRGVRAKLLAREGRAGEALALAEQAVLLLGSTDAPAVQADALLDLADVHMHAGRVEEAVEAVGAARLRYGFKGHVVGSARADALLADLGGPEARLAPGVDAVSAQRGGGRPYPI